LPRATRCSSTAAAHAIDAGNLILEIQENSDTTYRVYDWGRVGLDGKPRKLHVQESLRSIDFTDFEPPILHSAGREQTLVESPIFHLRRVSLEAGQTLAFAKGQQPRILSVVEGALREKCNNRHLEKGVNVLLPFEGDFVFVSEGAGASVLITERFA
jgi:mannose-6-phosphate isomerase